MNARFRPAVRFALLAAAVLVGGAMQPDEKTTSPTTGDQLSVQEVRIRKLHLVRPDLLPYPLFYEVVC